MLPKVIDVQVFEYCELQGILSYQPCTQWKYDDLYKLLKNRQFPSIEMFIKGNYFTAVQFLVTSNRESITSIATYNNTINCAAAQGHFQMIEYLDTTFANLSPPAGRVKVTKLIHALNQHASVPMCDKQQAALRYWRLMCVESINIAIAQKSAAALFDHKWRAFFTTCSFQELYTESFNQIRADFWNEQRIFLSFGTHSVSIYYTKDNIDQREDVEHQHRSRIERISNYYINVLQTMRPGDKYNVVENECGFGEPSGSHHSQFINRLIEEQLLPFHGELRYIGTQLSVIKV